MSRKMAGNHEGFCVRSIKSKVQHVDIPSTENFDFAEALESIYPILELVFDFLNYEDLTTCCLVKKSWKEVAENILSKRMQPSWFTYYRTKIKPKPNFFKHSHNLGYNNVGIGIILYDFRRISLNRYVCLHANTTELSRKTVPAYLEEELVPPGIEYCVICCPNVVSHFDPNIKYLCDVGMPDSMDGLFIPKIPNIRTTMFHCNAVKKEYIQETVALHIKHNEEVKCLLLFSTKDLNKSLYNLLRYLIPENEAATVAVGGGITRGTKTFITRGTESRQNLQRNSKRIYTVNDAFCIAFLKDKYCESDFNAYSLVVPGDDLSRAEFEEKLVKFKAQIILRTFGVGIRICCSAKVGTEEEPVIFNKLFPNIPLLGCNADGEIGWDCIYTEVKNDDGESQAKKTKYKYPKVQHQWSTVFVLMTWGAIKSHSAT